MFIDPNYFMLPMLDGIAGQGSIYNIDNNTQENTNKLPSIGFIQPNEKDKVIWHPEIYRI